MIGGGPGGLVTALYLARFRRRVAVVNAGRPRADWIPRTHNLIGYDRGISGRMLLARLHRQLGRCEVERFRARARVDRAGGPGDGFVVTLEAGAAGAPRQLRARTVVLATGIRDVQPKIDNVDELRAAGLLRYCSICDGFEYRDQPIAILAADHAGLDRAFFIQHWTRDMRIILPRTLKLPPSALRRIDLANIRPVYCDLLRMEKSRSPFGLCITVDDTAPFYARAAYVELGCEVLDSAWAHLRGLRRARGGFVITTQEQRTSIPGLFAVGDCVNSLGQIGVAAGQAAQAATAIHNDLLG